MASYLRSWLRVGTNTPDSLTANNSPTQSVLDVSPLPSDDDDIPPAFPSLSSAQRASATVSGLPRVLTDSELMPPPPAPIFADRNPGVAPTPGALTVPATTRPMPKRKGKVGLAPGHSPLDWANLKASGENLRVSVHRWWCPFDEIHVFFSPRASSRGLFCVLRHQSSRSTTSEAMPGRPSVEKFTTSRRTSLSTLGVRAS